MKMNMEITLKDGKLAVALRAPHVRALKDACDVCQTVSALSPIDPKLKEAATVAADALAKLLPLCATPSDNTPLLETKDADEASETEGDA